MSYLSRVRLDPAAPAGLTQLRKLAVGPYAEHQILWTLWGHRPDAERDFQFRRVDGGVPAYYLLSAVPPEAESPGWLIETKPFNPQIDEGSELAFELRANPVITRREPDGKSRRHDVVCDALRAQSAADEQGRADIERSAGLAWLARQSERHGFAFDPEMVRAGAYRQEQIRGAGQSRDIRYSSLDYSGRLTVTDAGAFLACVRSGLGKAKAFGCGLFLLRRIF